MKFCHLGTSHVPRWQPPVVEAVVVEVVVTKAAVEVDDVVGTLMTPGLLFSVVIVTIPAVHIATSITNQATNL